MKKLVLLLTVMLAFVLTACGPTPTGDPAKDAKNVAKFMTEQLDKVEKPSDIKVYKEKMTELKDKFVDYYKEKSITKQGAFVLDLAKELTENGYAEKASKVGIDLIWDGIINGKR